MLHNKEYFKYEIPYNRPFDTTTCLTNGMVTLKRGCLMWMWWPGKGAGRRRPRWCRGSWRRIRRTQLFLPCRVSIFRPCTWRKWNQPRTIVWSEVPSRVARCPTSQTFECFWLPSRGLSCLKLRHDAQRISGRHQAGWKGPRELWEATTALQYTR